MIDSHGYMAGLGDLLESLNLRGVRSVAEIAERVNHAASTLPKTSGSAGAPGIRPSGGGQSPLANRWIRPRRIVPSTSAELMVMRPG